MLFPLNFLDDFRVHPTVLRRSFSLLRKDCQKKSVAKGPNRSQPGAIDSTAHDDTVAARRRGRDVLFLGLGGARRAVVAAAGAAAVEADALALAGDAVALARAGGAVRGRGAVARDGAGRAGAVAEVRVVVRLDLVGGKLLGELIDVVVVEDGAGGVGGNRLGRLDLRGRQGAALGDVPRRRLVARGALVVARRRRRRLVGLGAGAGRLGDVEDVELAAGGAFDARLDRGVVGDVVAVDDVVVPVALARLQGRAGEAESALPRAGLGRGLVLGEGKLSGVVVPRAEEMDRLDAGGDAKRERELSGRHFELRLKLLVLEN